MVDGRDGELADLVDRYYSLGKRRRGEGMGVCMGFVWVGWCE